MSTKSTLKEDHKSEIEGRSEEELLEEKSGINKHWIVSLNLIKAGVD